MEGGKHHEWVSLTAMIGVLLGLVPAGSAIGVFLLQWSIQSGGDCFPDDDGVYVSLVVAVLVFAVTSGLLVPLGKRKPDWRRGLLVGWFVGLLPFVFSVIHLINYMDGLGSGCPDGSVPPPW